MTNEITFKPSFVLSVSLCLETQRDLDCGALSEPPHVLPRVVRLLRYPSIPAAVYERLHCSLTSSNDLGIFILRLRI
jgi:hypothetical protein